MTVSTFAAGATALMIAMANGTTAISAVTATTTSTATYREDEPSAFRVNSVGRGFRLTSSDIGFIGLSYHR
jgi:hypothetical protein